MRDRSPLYLGLGVGVAALVVAAASLRWAEDRPVLGVLFATTAVVLAGRAVPPRRVPLAVAVTVEAVGSVAAGALFAAQPNPGLGTLLYLSAVYFGVRFRPRISIPLAVLLGGTVAVGYGTADSAGLWIGLSVALSVWAGISRRNRRERTEALEKLVEQTRLAAAADARSSALAERARIARDLHDVLAHTLSGAGLQLELADALLEADRSDDARVAVARARREIAAGVVGAHDAVVALRTDTIDLPAALASLAEGENEHVRVAAVALDHPAARAVLRIAQEAFTNARRHAPGAPIDAALEPAGDGARLTVSNSAGTAPGAPPGSGMGLLGMRERAAEVNGTLLAGPTSDGGWTAALTVPHRASPW